MYSRRPRLIAAFAAMAAMLFLQATLAFAGCDLPSGSSAMAAMQMDAMPDCDEGHDAGALCAAHCQSEDQTLGKLQFPLPDLAQAVSILVLWRPAQPVQSPAPRLTPHAAPPPRILFQSFLL